MLDLALLEDPVVFKCLEFFAQPKWINEEFFDLRPGRLDASKEGGQILDQRVQRATAAGIRCCVTSGTLAVPKERHSYLPEYAAW